MSDTDRGALHNSSEGGVAGKLEPAGPFEVVAGPSTSDEFNTARLRLVPVACFRVDDIRFAFGSSFVTSDSADEKNDIRAELKILVELLKEHTEAPLSVFGHADPIGNDDFNKQLSGRRATVVYALLISSTEPDSAIKLWQRVAKEENWGANERQQMQGMTGLPAGTPDSDLFKAYMGKLTPAGLTLGKQNFLAQGADAQGKGDFQGCSEFNPDLIFSTKKNNEFEKAQDKTPRNDANSPNRRVMVLLFQKGNKVEPAQWPCPRATEGPGGCRARFWSDGDSRRSKRLPDKDRTFDETKDTFACRFYHRLTTSSPCESPLRVVKIRLFDPQGRPLPFAPCLITETGKEPQPARATGAPASPPPSSGVVETQDALITVRVLKLPATVNLKWSRPKAGEGARSPLPQVFTDRENEVNGYKYEFDMDVTIDIPDADSEAASKLRLKNLAYVEFPADPDNIRAFQKDYKPRFAEIVEDGTLNQPTIDAIKTTHESADPVFKAGSQIAVKR